MGTRGCNSLNKRVMKSKCVCVGSKEEDKERKGEWIRKRNDTMGRTRLVKEVGLRAERSDQMAVTCN